MPAPSPINPTHGPPFGPATVVPPPGGGGTIAGAVSSTVQGVCVAFGSPTLEQYPAWTRLDDPAAINATTGWSISRGRSYELDKTQVGTATITLVDTVGRFDPTNATSPFAGQINPMKQAAIALQNPVDLSWNTLYRGFVSGWHFDMDVSEKLCTVSLELVDAFALLAALEMTPGNVGTTAPDGADGDIYFDGAGGQWRGITDHIGPDERINAALDDAGWPAGLRNIFTGNVALQDVKYARRDDLLSVLFDAADAEFPGVSNVYASRDGKIRFRGRFARFDPTNPGYGITFWNCGDATAAAASTAVAPISGLSFSRDDTHLINAALAIPATLDDTDVPGQLVKDTASIATYGWRGTSFSDLLVYKGEEGSRLSAADETKQYATYYVQNYKDPRTRVSTIRFRMGPATGPNAEALWRLICGVEISDVVRLTTTHPGGGGFNAEDFFVEGIRYDARPGGAALPDLTLELDVSPRAYYTTSPFS